MSISRRTFGAIVLALGAVACGSEASEAQEPTQAGARRYDTRGVVREIRRERSSITIHHEDVPGYMPSMTMPFDLEDLGLLDGVSVGDTVEFTFSREEGGRHVIRSLRRVS